MLLRNAATRVTFLFLFHTTTTQHHPSLSCIVRCFLARERGRGSSRKQREHE